MRSSAGLVLIALAVITSAAQAVVVTESPGGVLFKDNFEGQAVGLFAGGPAQVGTWTTASDKLQIQELGAVPGPYEGVKYMNNLSGDADGWLKTYANWTGSPTVGSNTRITLAMNVGPGLSSMQVRAADGSKAQLGLLLNYPNPGEFRVLKEAGGTSWNPTVTPLNWQPGTWQVWTIDVSDSAGTVTFSVGGTSSVEPLYNGNAATGMEQIMFMSVAGGSLAVDAPEPASLALLVLSGLFVGRRRVL